MDRFFYPPESSALSSINSTELDAFEQSSASSSNLQTQQPNLLPKCIRNRSSFVWNHMPGPANTMYTKEGTSLVVWRCKYCLKELLASGGTAHIA
jgi:hypothetical protein